MQRCAPRLVLVQALILILGVIPHVPLVQRQVDGLLGVLRALHAVADGGDGLNELVQIHRRSEEVLRVVVRIAVVAVQGDVVHVVVRLHQHFMLPSAEGGHACAGRTARNRLDGGVNPLHDLRGFVCLAAVLVGGFRAGLPRAVHFVAQAPQLDVKRVFRAVLDAQVAPRSAGGMVAVFNDVLRVENITRAEVDGVHDLRVRLLRPVDELMQTECVRLGRLPRQVEAARTLLLRADGILPAEAGDEVSARIAHDRHVQLAHQIQHVAAEPLFIRQRMGRLVNASIDGAAQVLNERTVQAAVDGGDDVVLVQNQLGLFHVDRVLLNI